MAQTTHTRLNLSATLASVSVALLLMLAKLWAFHQTGALSVAASLADSAADLLMSLAGLAAVLYAARPPDEDHAFGHTSVEDLAALGQSLFILVSAGVIAWAAGTRLVSGAPSEISGETGGMAVMALAIGMSVGLVLWQTRVLRRTGSAVVEADRLHYLGDLVPNIGALISLWAARTYGIGSLDSLVAIGAALLLAAGALRIGARAWDGLMDRAPDPALSAAIGEMADGWPGIEGHHDLKTRRAGSRVFVNLHVEIDGGLSLDEAHDIAAALRRAILHAYPQTDVIIHKDPVGVQPHPDDPTRAR